MLIRNISRRLLCNWRAQTRMFSGTLRKLEHFEGLDAVEATRVTMLSQENDTMMYIEAYSTMGFKLNNGFRILGPCAIFPRSVLHWNVRSSEDISIASLSLFTMLEPKLDILILGIGSVGSRYDKSIVRYLRSKKINVEILPTDQACSTLNFLNAEHRYVAGALIPPNFISFDNDEDAMVRAQLERRNLYESDTSVFENADKSPGLFDENRKYLKEYLGGKDDSDDKTKK